jgi:chaperonin GroES
MGAETAVRKKVNFKPLKERVFVSYSEEQDRTSGGLYIPDAAKEKPQKGRVEAIGAEVKAVKVGDEVLFDKYSGSKITFDGADYLIIKEDDILGVIEK